jgi:hypothetical protein
VFIIEDRTVTEWLQGVIKDVTVSPTKKRRQGTAAKYHQPSESRSYVKAVALNRRDLSKLPAFGHTDAHGSGGPHIKLRDTGLGDM